VTITFQECQSGNFYSASAKRCISYDRFCLTVRLTVCHSPVSCQNDSSYDHAVFTEDSPMTLVSSTLNFSAKFQGEHRERGRRM